MIGKGAGVGLVTQSVAVAAPINVGPVYGAGVALAPVYTGFGGALGGGAPIVAGPTFVPGPVSLQPLAHTRCTCSRRHHCSRRRR